MKQRNISPIIAEMETESRRIMKSTVLDLDGFLALNSTERAERWQQFTHSAKFQLVALMLTRRFGDWDDETVEQWIAHYDEKWSAAQEAPASSDLPTLDAALLHETAAELARIAQFSDDRAAANALNKASYHLAHGVRPVLTAGDWLVPSATSAATIYRLTGMGCSCEAGRNGRQCWHSAIVEITMLALERAAAAADHGPAAPELTPAQFGRRLAAARAASYHITVYAPSLTA